MPEFSVDIEYTAEVSYSVTADDAIKAEAEAKRLFKEEHPKLEPDNIIVTREE